MSHDSPADPKLLLKLRGDPCKILGRHYETHRSQAGLVTVRHAGVVMSDDSIWSGVGDGFCFSRQVVMAGEEFGTGAAWPVAEEAPFPLEQAYRNRTAPYLGMSWPERSEGRAAIVAQGIMKWQVQGTNFVPAISGCMSRFSVKIDSGHSSLHLFIQFLSALRLPVNWPEYYDPVEDRWKMT
jgi:hypothetical protein